MKVIHRIPTAQYAYIEFEEDVDGPAEAIANHAAHLAKWEDTTGLGTRDWAKLRNEFYATGKCNPESIERLSKSQRFVINEMKLAQRALDPQQVETLEEIT